MPIHLRAEPGDYADACLLPGDPLRAKYISETFLEDARQVNGERGLLGLQIGGTELAVRVAGVVPRVPGASGDVALGDVDTLVTALTAARPGSARANEVWLGVSEQREPAVRADRAHQVEVLEDRHRRDPARTLEHAAAHEQRLIAVRQTREARAQGDPELERAEARAGCVEAQPERAAGHARIVERGLHRGAPARLEARVGVQEEQHLALRRGHSRRELQRTAGRWLPAEPRSSTSAANRPGLGPTPSMRRRSCDGSSP